MSYLILRQFLEEMTSFPHKSCCEGWVLCGHKTQLLTKPRNDSFCKRDKDNVYFIYQYICFSNLWGFIQTFLLCIWNVLEALSLPLQRNKGKTVVWSEGLWHKEEANRSS